MTVNATERFSTFRVADVHFAVPVSNVQEVLRYQDMTRVPLAPSTVAGLINLRGNIVMAVDLRRRLELPARAAGQRPMNVVVRTESETVSLLVDEIGEVIAVDEDALELPPPTVAPATRALILGVYKLTDKLLLVLDVTRVLELGPPAHCNDERGST